jgi:hypothetical protein
VDIVKLIIGVAVGLLDEAAEGHVVLGAPAEDVARVGLFATGLLVDFAGRGPVREVGEALQVAAAPLLTKTLAKYAKAKKYTPRVVVREATTPPAPAPLLAPSTSITSW